MATYGSNARRGLPRTRGGEPWPPAAASVPVPAASAAASVPALAASVVPALAESAAASVPALAETTAPLSQTAGSGSVNAQIATAEPGGTGSAGGVGGAAAGARTVRRGLPRTPGGEPWPLPTALAAASVVPALADTTAPLSQTAGSGSVNAQIATAERGGVGAEHGAGAGAERGAGADAAGAGHAAGADASGLAVAARDVLTPLPFTPTVWLGQAACTRPAPRPEPKRIGPFTRAQWAGVVIVGGLGILFAAGMAVLAVRWLISLEGMQDFLRTYPGEYHLPEGAPVGLPAWLGWQHFFNVFLMVLIIRSGLQVRTEKRPGVFWAPRRNPKGKISLALWFHQSLDILWVLNGLVFLVLLFVTGQWMRIVPTSWEVFPNAVSAVLQYVSLDWPTENGWVNYNALQQLAYFTTVFIAAPLAIVTGVRMSGFWPKNARALNKAYPIEWARAVHFPVMLYFVVFIVIHVLLVLATGALRNLNHMYAAQDAVNWVGFWIFVASLGVIAAAWAAARPLVLAPIAKLFGTVSGR